ncbi:protein phosphatase 2C domain-containing protein [Salinilacihabitans rarus]|uniref:protein phosphatase 2C domain-containing protein n=1 Tax=Salinilacihabitans rarus TaxID=2961596 RepID=UPI0020C871BB|nr:protein phosphatase 2C domain-containing protein [Salinilacihabitans rarus]
MEHASTVDIGARKRRIGGVNEDSIATAVLQNHHRRTNRPVGVFVLGDGVGGEASGDVASFLATTVVRKRLTETILGAGTDVPDRFGVDALDEPPTADDDPADPFSEERIRTAIQEAADTAHRRVQAFARDAGGRPATTLVVCVYVDGRLHYGWVGDSRVYVINTAHEEIQQLTRDHAVTNELLDRGEIDDEVYARVHEDATAITNAIGGSPHGRPSVDVEFGTADVYDDDVIMLTSDGLIDAFPNVEPLREEYQRADDTDAARESILDSLVTDDELMEIVLEEPDLHAAVERLISFANDRGGKDNLSVALVQDPDAESSPTSLPIRGEAVAPDELIEQETLIESPRNGEGDGSDADDGSRSMAEVVTPAGEIPTAAIRIANTETIYEIVEGVTVGRDAGDGADEGGPNIGLVVDDDSVERNHARLERDDEGHWLLRDISDTGTYVAGDEEWLALRSDDPDAEETCRLRDGAAFALEDPRKTDPVTFRFFTSVERARLPTGAEDEANDSFLGRFRS